MIRRLVPYAILFIAIETITRISLLLRAWNETGVSVVDAMKAMAIGLWFDITTLSFFLIVPALYYLLLPTARQGSTLDRRVDLILRVIFSFILLFASVSEHLFWSEFSTRFNFIAVDYLVYTNEVLGNIVESYPVGWLILVIAAIASAIGFFSAFMLPIMWPLSSAEELVQKKLVAKKIISEKIIAEKFVGKKFINRAGGFAGLLLFAVAMWSASRVEWTNFSDNTEASEVAANGIYNLFYAFWNNEINYDRFYATQNKEKVAVNTHKLLTEEYSDFNSDAPDELVRTVRSGGNELHKNVIIVVMESMSAEYMKTFGSGRELTPNLDQLAKEGLLFSRTYATGTRTVRGLEALVLSLPPTPGQSIIRRPDNEGLFSLGFIFKDRGYDTRFIYGGYGYFDNMNGFFSANGFDIVDRSSMSREEVHFANAWGVADDDMFMRLIKEADQSYAAGKPFMHMIMTTSNHRPYTYPEGKIDIPSKKGREGGVKFADYSIGVLLKEAKRKPWFKDTLFIFVADHTAGVAGKVELDPGKYHIPMIFYAPAFIKPGRYDKIASQIDMAPVLLGKLQFNYRTKFYGEDLLHDSDEIPHAFISNYQKVALVRDGIITILSPKRAIKQIKLSDETILPEIVQQDKNDAIAFYESASWWKEKYRRIPTVIDTMVLDKMVDKK